MEMSNEHIIYLIEKHFNGSIASDELKDLKAWIRKNEENNDSFNQYIDLIINARSLSIIDKIDQAKAWENLKNSIHKSRKGYFGIIFKVAASILILLSISATFFWITSKTNIQREYTYDFTQVATPGRPMATLELSNGCSIELLEHKEEVFSDNDGLLISKDSTNKLSYLSENNVTESEMYNTLKVPRGGEFSLTLSDGTRVWLNAESELRYPVVFIGSERNVYLKGEGYFEVSQNKTVPFFINIEDSRIQVLGTSFNVSAYKSQGYSATTLVKGSVKVIMGNDIRNLIPGQQLKHNSESKCISIENVDTSIYTAWVNGVFEFENMTLNDITDQLGRWYDVEFIFENKECKVLHFTGGIKRDESINLIIEMIEKTTNVKFAIKGNAIKVSN